MKKTDVLRDEESAGSNGCGESMLLSAPSPAPRLFARRPVVISTSFDVVYAAARKAAADGEERSMTQGVHHANTKKRLPRRAATSVQLQQDLYAFERPIGRGSSAVVWRVLNRDTGDAYACKCFISDKNDSTRRVVDEALLGEGEEGVNSAEEEAAILSRLDHPNIVSCHGVISKDRKTGIVTELLGGGQLSAAVEERGSLAEDDARDITAQILDAVAHMHSRGVAHRDLKLDNIVLRSADDLLSVCIVDFGLAACFPVSDCAVLPDSSSSQINKPPALFKKRCGTVLYVAPEVLRKDSPPYDEKCDVWSVGVILFKMLSGYPPFGESDLHAILGNILNGSVNFEDPVWELIDAAPKDLIRRLLTVDPALRPSAREARMHPWLVSPFHR